MPWQDGDELQLAWLGAYGPEREQEAEEHLDACLGGGAGPDIQQQAETMMAGLQQYIAEGHPVGDELAEIDDEAPDATQAENAYITQQIEALEAESGREFSDDEIEAIYRQAVENPDANGVPDVRSAAGEMGGASADEDQATALIAAELDRLSEFKGRPLTQGQLEEAIAAIPYEAHDGGLVPDLVKQLGEKFRDGDLEDNETRLQRGVERGREVAPESPDLLQFDREEARDDEQHDYLERGLEAAIAAREGVVENGASREERMAAAHDAVLAFSGEGGGDE